ncbi:FHA domain-containing protein [Microbacterium alcoholitolerans]|uniref:FHA domain-containing protein n=1 Tax=unclassified Microbacterium TaxID=2609290 RepID=UPI003D17251F
MNDVTYRPGEWQVVIEESGIAALPADASADKVVALSAMLGSGVPELTEVIDVLSGGAITGLGSFAVALIGPNGTRFAVRGAVTVSTGLDESFSGEHITTWSERFIAEPPRFEIGFGAASSVEYPIRSGVVLASGVRVGEPFTEQAADGADEDVTAMITTDDDEEQAADAESPVTSEDAPEDAPEEADATAEDAAAEPADPEAGADAAPTEEAVTDEVATATIAPDEVADLRGRAMEQDAEGDSLGEPDLGATIAPPVRGAEPAPPMPAPPVPGAVPAVLPPPAPPAPPAAPAATDIGDHDGATISLAEARRLRGATSAPDAPTEVMPVLSDGQGGSTSARIRMSTGQVVELDRSVIIGRKPRSTRASGATLPHLIAVDSPQSDISRNHLEVRPEGDSVVVIDLHTTNGSTLLRPGADPVRLHPGEQTLVLGGDVIDVGDGVTVAIEEFG